MAEPHDATNWTNIGYIVGGLLTGLGAAFGIKRRPRNAVNDKVRAEIRALQDAMLSMGKDLTAMENALKDEVADRKALEDKHDKLLSGIFGEMKTMSTMLTRIETTVSLALGGNGHER